MLKLDDFFHLPQVDALFDRLNDPAPGLIVVTGLDPRPLAGQAAAGGVLASGRSTIFRILMREMIAARPETRALVITADKGSARFPRSLRRQVDVLPVMPSRSYRDHVQSAIRRRPDLLVIDHLTPDNAPVALEAAQHGLRVLSQIDTVFRGTGVARHLLDLGAAQPQLAGLAWVIAVQRLATLCPHCKQPVPPDETQIAWLRQRYPHLDDMPLPSPDLAGITPVSGPYYRARGCQHCDHSGHFGDVIVFDIFRSDANTPALVDQASALSMEDYVLHLGLLGYAALDDVLTFEAEQVHRTYDLLRASETALVESNTALERKLVELEAANRVLEQRTKALISLQEIGQALLSSTDLEDLAARVCHQACDLCGADRAILYFLQSDDCAEVLAVGGWETSLIHEQFTADQVLIAGTNPEPVRFNHWPPGVPVRPPEVEGAALRAGLYVPLIAQDEPVGLMIVHTTRKPRFEPGETSLLQTFANQAALAIQRAGLIWQLRAKIDQLEAAQAELVQKERMERELELARQVQQSVLPLVFPQVTGYTFAAHNEPARQVGGDFYDVIMLDADHFGVAIADVSDKGMPAALYMALARSLLLAEARRERSPRAVLASVNHLLLELGQPNMFVTVFYGVVERGTHRLTYTRAGHDLPLLLRGHALDELQGTGTALGLFASDELHLSEEHVTLESGDRLVLYTDGLTDVLAPDGRLFDHDRLAALVRDCAGQSAPDLCASIVRALSAYRGSADQYDDMTMLIVAVD